MRRSEFIKTIGLAVAGTSISRFAFSAEPQHGPGLSPVLVDANGEAITTLPQWEKQRLVIRKRWSDYLGVLKPNPDAPVLTVISEDRPEGLVRQLVSYEGEPGISVKGYLIKPAKIAKPLPGVVAMHSTSDGEMQYIAGVKQGKIVPFGYRLAKQGFVVFCPQCYLMRDQGNRSYLEMAAEEQERHPHSKGMAKMLFDAQRAVDVLANLDEADKTRIGATGHSLGGKEVFYLGAFDDRVKVIVSNEGGIGIDFSNWDAVWYLGKSIHDFPHQHHELLALVAPKKFLLIGGDFADGARSRPYIEAVLPVYDLYGKRENIALMSHDQGHGVTPEAEARTYEWLRNGLR